MEATKQAALSAGYGWVDDGTWEHLVVVRPRRVICRRPSTKHIPPRVRRRNPPRVRRQTPPSIPPRIKGIKKPAPSPGIPPRVRRRYHPEELAAA